LIAAGPAVDPDPADPAVAQDMRRAPRMVLVVRAGRCIPRGPSPVALPAPEAGPRLALHALDLARAPASVRLGPVPAARAV
jgi:hypothetical protein